MRSIFMAGNYHYRSGIAFSKSNPQPDRRSSGTIRGPCAKTLGKGSVCKSHLRRFQEAGKVRQWPIVTAESQAKHFSWIRHVFYTSKVFSVCLECRLFFFFESNSSQLSPFRKVVYDQPSSCVVMSWQFRPSRPTCSLAASR